MMVVDSSDAPNYDAWQNNVYGDGAEVPFDDHLNLNVTDGLTRVSTTQLHST
jgi:hypothetical protein